MLRWGWVLAGLVATGVGCNALTGASDLSVSACVDGCGADDGGPDVPTTAPPPDADVADGGAEASGCEPGTTACGGDCVSLTVDDDNCGICGRACGPNKACAGGDCVSTCNGGVECTTTSGVVCVDRLTNTAHCGACNSPCPGTATCINGGCRYSLSVSMLAPASSGSTVTSSAGGISCPGTCSANVVPGTSVTLTAAPAADESFVEWTGGGCAGRALTCVVSVDSAKSVTARFAKLLLYANSKQTLFRVDATTGSSTTIGSFSGGCASVEIGDIAIDRNGGAYAFTREGSSSRLFSLDLATAACGASAIGASGPLCPGATFAQDPTDPTKDALYCGSVYELVRVNTTTGSRTLVGDYGPTTAISGDIVWVPGKGAFITLVSSISPTLPNRLGALNLTTGAVTLIGPTNELDLYGLGHRGGNLIACSPTGVYSINTTTANATKLPQNPGFDCSGAASGP